MQIITRENYPSIKKLTITKEPEIYYESLDLNLIENLLQETITDYTYNTIDLITLLRENYHSSLASTVESIPDFSNVRFNCYYASKILKAKLEEYGIKTMYISYKSIGFSTPIGDNIIKEAHQALLLPTKRENKDYYLILDPGYRLPKPLGFYKEKLNDKIIIDNDIIKISTTKDKTYPYSMNMQGYNRYSLSKTSYECVEYFNANYETINPEEILFPLSYRVLDGYRAIKYSEDSKKRATIKIMLLDKYIECLSSSKREILTFKQFKNSSLTKLLEIMTPYTEILKISPTIIAEDFNFIIDNCDEFVNNIMDKEVVKEKVKLKRECPK